MSTKKTQVFNDKFKGKEMFTIWEVDKKGNKVGERPLVSFGAAKAALIYEHRKELTEYVKNNSVDED